MLITCFKGKIQVGDILDRVDDVDASVLSNEELARLMLGPPGTSIVCSFRRKDER